MSRLAVGITDTGSSYRATPLNPATRKWFTEIMGPRRGKVWGVTNDAMVKLQGAVRALKGRVYYAGDYACEKCGAFAPPFMRINQGVRCGRCDRWFCPDCTAGIRGGEYVCRGCDRRKKGA